MQRCLQLAANGSGTTAPNPMVGSVLVHNGRIIGEGWHLRAGEAHAEVRALDSVKPEDRGLIGESTLYVNLEPCAHHGRTPPCSDRIIREGIPEVVVGCRDPFSEVNGKGIRNMLDAGITVTEGVLEKEALELNRRFFTFHQKKRPYIILKWAQSADGFLAPLHQNTGHPLLISSPESRQLVHRWRSDEAAILVGRGTWEKDRPLLDTRHWSEPRPRSLVLDPAGNSLLGAEGVWQLTEKAVPSAWTTGEHRPVLEATDILGSLMKELYSAQLLSLFVEGGAETLHAFLAADLWDELRVFVSPAVLGEGVPAPAIAGRLVRDLTSGPDHLSIYRP